MNAWPLDEGLIDCVDPASVIEGENSYATLNIIANPKVTIAGVEVDAPAITPDLIGETLNEADGIETNVAPSTCGRRWICLLPTSRKWRPTGPRAARYARRSWPTPGRGSPPS